MLRPEFPLHGRLKRVLPLSDESERSLDVKYHNDALARTFRAHHPTPPNRGERWLARSLGELTELEVDTGGYDRETRMEQLERALRRQAREG